MKAKRTLDSSKDGVTGRASKASLAQFPLRSAALEALEQHIVVLDGNGTVRVTNAAWRRFRCEAGLSVDRCVGKHYTEVCLQGAIDRADAAALSAGLEDVLANTLGRARVEFPYGSPHTRCWFSVTVTPLSDAAGAVVSYQEVTERKHYERLIEDQANRDPLTGLFNRRFFMLEAQKTLALARQSGGEFALLYLDLDHFKEVNDRFGHSSGDALLRKVSERLKVCTREGDLVARLGGDEFAVLLQHVSRQEGQKALARYRADLAIPFGVKGGKLYLGGSFGAAYYPDDGDDVAALLEQADGAMYHAKERRVQPKGRRSRDKG